MSVVPTRIQTLTVDYRTVLPPISTPNRLQIGGCVAFAKPAAPPNPLLLDAYSASAVTMI